MIKRSQKTHKIILLEKKSLHVSVFKRPYNQDINQKKEVSPVEEVLKPKRKKTGQANNDTLAGYLFLLPMLLLTGVLTIIPIIMSFFISFTDWNFIGGFSDVNFIWFDNYKEVLTSPDFGRALLHNLALLIIIPIILLIALVLAVLINNVTYFKSFFKVVYFMPFISSFVAVAVLWRVLFHPETGPINGFLRSVGIDNPPGWLADPNFALIAVMIIMIWASIGFNMILYMAGLQNISAEIYEAADIDGASKIKQFFRLTLPLLSPTTFFLLITGIVGSFKAFDLIIVLTGGGPAGSTHVIVSYLYEMAFINLNSGVASAIGIILLIILLLITLVQWIGQKKWVNY